MTSAGTWQLRSLRLDISGGALIGIVNVTPDSFTDGGRYLDHDAAVAHGLRLAAAGAAVVDVGGESTRPGASPVPVEVELQRVLPVVRRLAREGVLVSVDTYKPEVASACLDAGAEAVNDVTGFVTPGMLEVAASSGCGVVAMHMQGTPKTMSINPEYVDVVGEVEQFLLAAATRLQNRGVDRSRIVIDPGLGFGKRAHHSLALLDATCRLSAHGLPLMLGASRKGFLAHGDSVESPDLDLLTAVTTAVGYALGARLFRVHDVAVSKQALALAAAIRAQIIPGDR